MKTYAGIDLHSTNLFVTLLDETGKVVEEKRLSNDADKLIHLLSPYRDTMETVAIESTYNWYWLADRLIEENYDVRLVNTTAVVQYNGLKHTNDKTDARWLGELSRLNLLPEGHIYPKEKRPVRELLRQRLGLVQQQTQYILKIQGLLVRYQNIKLSAEKIKQLDKKALSKLVPNQTLCYSIESLHQVLLSILKQVQHLELLLKDKLSTEQDYKNLLSVPGVGKILATTILLETGDIKRFRSSGSYVSYCRCVPSHCESNGKKKGENNRKKW